MCTHHFHLDPPIKGTCVGHCVLCDAVKTFPFGFSDALQYAQKNQLKLRYSPNMSSAERACYMINMIEIHQVHRRASKGMNLLEDRFG